MLKVISEWITVSTNLCVFFYCRGESWLSNLLNIISETGVSASQHEGNADFKAVTRSLLKTQPPRYEDIPDMVEYVKVYGGLPSGVFIKNLAIVSRHFMPTGRIVSGSFFKMLADIHLKFGTSTQPAHLVNAVLLTHMCHAAEQDQ